MYSTQELPLALSSERLQFYLATIVAILSVYVVYTLLDAVWLSPIAKVPGPFLNRITRLPLLWHTYKFQRSAYAHSLIEKYGPIVVIAPNQVHTTDERAMKVIYDRTSTKTRFYKGMGSWKGVVVTLGFIDYKSAAPSRNNLVQCFQNRNLDVLSEAIGDHVHKLTRTLVDMANQGKELDGAVWFRLLALDVVSDVLWGESSKLLDTVSDTTPDFLRRFNAFSKYNAMKSSIPGFETCVRLIGSQHWRTLRSDCNKMDESANQALTRWYQREKKHNRDVLSMLKDMESQDGTQVIPDSDFPAYLVEMMAAGSSTTALTMALASRMLGRKPEPQKRLREELFQSFPDPEKTISQRDTRDLPYLDAVVRETMRLWPAIPGPLERYLGAPIEVGPYSIPPGVVASTAAFDQGRLEEVFPNANDWNPDRWLDATPRMHKNWLPFGHGSRSCPGSNLALNEIRYALASVFRQLRAVPATRDHDPDEIAIKDVFAAGTRSGTCWLRFEHSPDSV